MWDKEKIREYNKRYYRENRERIIRQNVENKRVWVKENRDRVNKYALNYYHKVIKHKINGGNKMKINIISDNHKLSVQAEISNKQFKEIIDVIAERTEKPPKAQPIRRKRGERKFREIWGNRKTELARVMTYLENKKKYTGVTKLPVGDVVTEFLGNKRKGGTIYKRISEACRRLGYRLEDGYVETAKGRRKAKTIYFV
jgi:hypothetical protein